MAPYPEWQKELIREYAQTWRQENPGGTKQEMLRDLKQSGIAHKHVRVPTLISSPPRVNVPVPPLPDDFRLVPPCRSPTPPPEIAHAANHYIPAPLPPKRPFKIGSFD